MELVEQQKEVIELQKQIKDIEANRMMVEACKFAKRGSRLVANKVNEMKECIEEKASEYGKKLEYDGNLKIKSPTEANIIRNYTLALERINREFDNKYKYMLEEWLKLDNIQTVGTIVRDNVARKRNEEREKPEYKEEQELKEKAKFEIDDGNYTQLEEINKRLVEITKENNGTKLDKESKILGRDLAIISEAMELCEKEKNNCETQRRQTMELITGEKEKLLQNPEKKYLMVIERKSIFKKALGILMNKVNGNKRYTNNVTNVLTQKVENIENKIIPDLRKKLKEETEQVESKVKDIVSGITISSIEKETILKDKEENGPKKTFKSIISTARSSIMYAISKTEESFNKKETNEKESTKTEMELS